MAFGPLSTRLVSVWMIVSAPTDLVAEVSSLPFEISCRQRYAVAAPDFSLATIFVTTRATQPS